MANRNFMKFNKNKYQVLRPGWKTSLQQRGLRTNELESSSAGKDSGILVDKK